MSALFYFVDNVDAIGIIVLLLKLTTTFSPLLFYLAIPSWIHAEICLEAMDFFIVQKNRALYRDPLNPPNYNWTLISIVSQSVDISIFNVSEHKKVNVF
jgi:hypothetical protein